MKTKDIKVGEDYAYQADSYSQPQRVRITAVGQARKVSSGRSYFTHAGPPNGVHYVRVGNDGSIVAHGYRDSKAPAATIPSKITRTWEDQVVVSAKVAERDALRFAARDAVAARNTAARVRLQVTLESLGAVVGNREITRTLNHASAIEVNVSVVEAINALLLEVRDLRECVTAPTEDED